MEVYMEKNKWKLLCMVLGSAMMFSMAGCSVQNSENVVTTAASAVTTEKRADMQATDNQEPQERGELIFWDKSEYVEGYNTMMKAKVDAFAQEHNVDVNYVIIPAADMKQKLLAAIEAGNAPDLIVGDDTLVGQFVSMNQIADCADVFAAIDFTDNAKILGTFNGKEFLVPLAFMAPGMYLRMDKWQETGMDIPKTWEDLRKGAQIINDPANGFYGMGFAMGASGGGDAEGFCRTIILDWGGIPVDENGHVTVNSPETLEALKFIADLYEDGLIPPDAITGDDSWNNSAYLAGTVGVICNSGSVVSSMKAENPELLENTQIIAYPAGPKGTAYTLGGANVFGVFETGKNTETAKEFIKYYFADLDNYNNMIEAMGAMWQPVVKGVDDTEFWKNPVNAGWLANSKSTYKTYYPAPSDERATVSFTNQLCVKAVQEIVVNKTDPQEALNQLEAEFNKIYK